MVDLSIVFCKRLPGRVYLIHILVSNWGYNLPQKTNEQIHLLTT